MIERLPTPWGSSGSARRARPPEHQGCLAGVREDRAAARLQVLRQRRRGSRRHARGARTPLQRGRVRGGQTDRRLGIPGEDLPGSWAATELVAWYNGHPDFQELEFDLAGRRAIVIGNGNVALDVARMLALTRAEPEATDTTEPAIEAIASSGDRGDRRPRAPRAGLGRRDDARVAGVGRARGRRHRRRPGRARARPRQRGGARGRQRRSFAATSTCCASSPPASPMASPAGSCFGFESRQPSSSGTVAWRLSSSCTTASWRMAKAASAPRRPTCARPCLPTSSFAASATTKPRPSLDEAAQHLAERRRPQADESRATFPPGATSRWIKRGPTGVIGTNKADATETVELLLEDAQVARLPGRDTMGSPRTLAGRGVEPVLYSGWEAIDQAEREAGELLAGRVFSRGPIPRRGLAPQPVPGDPADASSARRLPRPGGPATGCGGRHLGMSRCVECLSCGLQRLVTVEAGECPRCGYVGWAPTASVTEELRRELRDVPAGPAARRT